MKLKPILKRCANGEESLAEVRRISENAVTHRPKEKLRCRPLVKPCERLRKVFHPWNGGRDWQQS